MLIAIYKRSVADSQKAELAGWGHVWNTSIPVQKKQIYCTYGRFTI